MPASRRHQPVDDLRHAPAPLWLYALAFVTLLLAGLAFHELVEAMRARGPTDLDTVLPAWVRAHRDDWPGLTALFRAVTVLGNFAIADIFILLAAAVLAVLHRARIGGVRHADAPYFVAVTLTGRLLNVGLKLWFERPRPSDIDWIIHETGLSFPSGHAVFAGVTFGMLAILLSRPSPRRPRWVRLVGVPLCALLAFLVAASRVWLGVHYPTDVIAGLVLGFGWAVAAWLIRSGWARWRHHRRRGTDAEPSAERGASR